MRYKVYLIFSLVMLQVALLCGVLSSFSFLYPETLKNIVPFQQLRPMHVSAALFWIISGAVTSLLVHSNHVAVIKTANKRLINTAAGIWALTITVIFAYYTMNKYGGREYWEFPPWLGIPLLLSWILLMVGYGIYWFNLKNKKPLYQIMWATGVLFFLLTFIEQNIWHIAWIRQSYIREVTMQWKANGSMVGAWNQMIYGTSLYMMVKMSGDKSIAENKKVYAFYFLSLSNLMFNWGHHIYNVPTASWVRHISYFISMTEWLFLISMIQSFKLKTSEYNKHKHLICYKFIIASEVWLFLNLLLAIMMSIPTINKYTHGTHITVAHAMGTTIGINTMILLGSIGYICKIDAASVKVKKAVTTGYNIAQVSLLIFWLCLVVAGLTKGYRSRVLHIKDFQIMMAPIYPFLKLFAVAGIGLLTGMGMIIYNYLKQLYSKRLHHE